MIIVNIILIVLLYVEIFLKKTSIKIVGAILLIAVDTLCIFMLVNAFKLSGGPDSGMKLWTLYIPIIIYACIIIYGIFTLVAIRIRSKK